MKNKRKSLISIVIFLSLITLISTFNEVFAYTTDTWVMPSTNLESEIDNTNVLHESGRFLVVYSATDSTNRSLHVKVYSSNGALEGTYTNKHVGGLSLYYLINAVENYNSTHAIIWTCYIYSGYAWTRWSAFLFNVATGGFTEYNANIQRGHVTIQFKGWLTATYDGDFYAICQTSISGNNTNLHLLKFDNDTLTLTHEAELTTFAGYVTTISEPLGFQDEDNLDRLYFLCAVDSSSTPQYFEADLSGSNLIYHATGGGAGNMQPTLRQHQHYLGGGIEESGSNKYLYHTWIYSNVSSLVRSVQVRQAVIEYHLGYIVPANITAQKIQNSAIFPNWLSETSPSWCLGYLNDYENYEVWLADREPTALPFVNHYALNTTDFFNMASTGIGLVSYEEEEDFAFPYTTEEEYLSRSGLGTFQFNNDHLENPDEAYVYGQLQAFADNWDITLTYTPVDSPLQVDTVYTFTGQTTNNAVGTQTTLLRYFDGVLQNTEETNANGGFSYSVRVGTGGTHNYTFEIYYEGAYEYQEIFTYVWSDVDSQDVDTGNVLPITVNSITSMLPVGFIMVGCPVLFYEVMEKTFIGALVGFIIGLGISTAVGLIPFYLTFLGVLAVVLAFVFMSRRG